MEMQGLLKKTFSRQTIYNIKIKADWGWLPEEP
jgi:hypothetical protein